jgi:diguanylate cyclase (GGDEF)-like protein
MSEFDATATSLGGKGGDDRRHSISAKIIFLVFLCTFSTALVISWIAIDSTHSQVRSRIDRGFPTALERSRNEIGPWLEAGRASLEELTPKTSERDLIAFTEASDHFDAIGIASSDGAWRATSGDLEDTKPPEPEGADTTRTTWLHEDSGWPAVVVPLGNHTLVARYDVPALAERLESQREDAAGTLMLTDADGRVLAAAGAEAAERTDGRHALAQLTGDAGEIHEYASEGGVHVLGAMAPLAEDDAWRIVIETTFAQAFSPVLTVVTKIFIADLLIILVFIMFAYRITTRMLRPIEDLSEGARQVSRGDLALAISDPGTRDEIGLLTRAFNDMMSKLQQSQSDLQEANRQLTGQNEELQRANEVLSQLSITDGLTKLHNHRYFQESLTREIKRHSRRDECLSMLLVDLDDFKALNDRLGHASGDELLVRVASIMAATVRESDLLARYGGEEFVVLAADTDLEGAVALAEKIRMAVEQTPHIVDDSLRPVRITVSAGVAQYAGNRRLFFEAADQALYRAKDQGKNCVVADETD